MPIELLTYPLTSPQLDIYQDQLLQGHSPNYNLGGFLEISGHLDIGLFERSLHHLTTIHDAFRLIVTRNGEGAPAQSIADAVLAELPVLNFSTSASPDADARAWIRREMNTPFALEQQKLFRWALLKIADERCFWFICMHHLIADGWSFDRIFSSLADTYRTLRDGGKTPAAAPSYLDFLATDRGYLRSERFETDRSYWRNEYKTIPEPLLSPKPSGTGDDTSGEISWRLPERLQDDINATAASAGSTKFQVILALYAAFMLRLRDRDTLIIGLSVLNRKTAEERRIVGLFANVVPVTISIEDEESLFGLLERIGSILRRRYRHQRFPIGELNRELELFRRHRSQLYELSISYEHGGRELVFGEASAVTVRCSTDHESTPLRLCVRDNLDTKDVLVYLIFRKDYLDAADAGALRDRLEAFMTAVLAEPARPLSSFPAAAAVEIETLRSWNDIEAVGPDGRCLHEMFEEQATRNGEAVALVHEGQEIHYAELNARSNRIAHAILAFGIRPDDRVALCAERGVDAIVGMLAVLKAGAAYVPIDPATVPLRARRVLADARPVVVLADAMGRSVLGAAATYPTIALDAPASGGDAFQNPRVPELRPHHLAYVIYTSGSTGTPKGVMVEHRNVVHQVRALWRAYALGSDERILQFASLGFDMSVEEIFPTLLMGAALVLRTNDCVQSPAEFVAFCAKHRLTSLNLPSGFWTQIALAEPEVALPASLRRVVSGGDAMGEAAVAAWFGRTGHRPPLFNAYGPTEATVNATLERVDAAKPTPGIGRPLPGVRIHLLDRARQPVPLGEPGELFIGGAGVARGYLGNPDLTAERFGPDPFVAEPEARMYRTGDLGRFCPDGSIEFLGRVDHQLKIRGYRVEPGEIESRLARLAMVREVAVIAQGERPEQRLVAYVVARGEVADERGFLDACRDALAAQLPDYMIPAAFVPLPALPLTANGKLDRNGLPDLQPGGTGHRAYDAPRTITERVLAGLWRELLGCGPIGRHDDFFDLGGHSLMAMRLLTRARRELGRAISLQLLFDQPTLAGLAAAMEGAGEDGPGSAPIRPVKREALMPLSSAQARLWFLSQLEEGGAAYHIPLVLRLAGELDEAALRCALDHLLARHEALRTVFVSVDGQPFGRILPDTIPFALVERDLSGEPDGAVLVERRAQAQAGEPFDLEHGPVIRGELLRVASGQSILLLCLHHIAGDGWSMEVLAREVGTAYAALVHGAVPALPTLPIQYPDWAAWQQAEAVSDRLRRQRAYWREQLKDAPELLSIPTDRPRPARQSFDGAAIHFRVDPPLCQALVAFCRRHGVTPFMVFAAVWSMVLARLSGQDDVLIGTLTANRGQSETEALIGFFVNTLVIRVDLSGDPNAAELLQAVRQTVLAMQENQDLPFEQVVEAVGPSRRLQHAPLFQVLLAWQSNTKAAWTLPGLAVEATDSLSAAIRYDLELHLFERDGAVTGLLGYSTALFDTATIDRHRGYLLATLAGLLAEPALPYRQLPLLGTQETALLRRWNTTSMPCPDHGLRVHHPFEAWARERPAATALIYAGREMSYATLDARANRWAQLLRELGAGPGQRIGICVDRGFAAVTAILAVLKAACAYVPLDPSYPAARLHQVLDEADVLLVLIDAVGLDALDTRPEPLPVLLDVADLENGSVSLRSVMPKPSTKESEPDNIAYVIYTSGSTGMPKGVAMPHRPLTNLLEWQRAETDRSGLAALRTLQFAAFGFDVAFQEIFSTFGGGGTLVLVDAATRLQFAELAEFVARHGVQRVFLPYVALQALAEALDGRGSEDPLPELREVIVAGEQLRLTPQIRRLFSRIPCCTLHNHYGPTETHVATAQVLSAAEVATAPSHVPIGRPIANVRAYVLDPYRQPVPIGASGELFIGGAGIARGYLHRPELTAERFLPDPFVPNGDALPSPRMYRTGDLARFRSDGTLLFLGRNDRQVQIRGFRVEIGEIEVHLAEHPVVRECAVIARDDGRGGENLVAYVACAAAPVDLPATLRAHLERLLPSHAVPSAFMALDVLPLTANGKLDRDALPAPDEGSFVRVTFAEPRPGTETVLAELWRELLDVPCIGRHDRFFDLGGHSLLAVRLLSRIVRAFGVRLQLATLFAGAALHELAAAIDERAEQPDEDEERPIEPAPRPERLPLSHAQGRLWFLVQLDEAASATYHVPLGFRLRGTVDADALDGAFRRLLDRHESLRTVFDADGGQPYARILPAGTGVVFRRHDLRGSDDADASLDALLADNRNRPFDLPAGPLIRPILVRLEEDRHALQITMHHMVADGWSLRILVRDLAGFYGEVLRGDPAAMPPLAIQYADYVYWERAAAGGKRLQKQADYWRQQLADVPALLELPTDRLRPARQSFAGAVSPVALDRDLTLRLRRLARQHNVSLLVVLLAAWSVVLCRLAGQDEVVVGIPAANRLRPELEDLVGFFVNTLALRIRLAEPLDAGALLSRVQKVLLDAQAHADLPFEQVVDLAGVPRRLDRTPLFQAILIWQERDETGIELPGIAVETRPTAFDWNKFELELVLTENDGRIEGGLGYTAGLFDRDTIDRHADYLHRLLEGMAGDATRDVQRMALLSPREEDHLLAGWNRTTTPCPDRLRIPGLLEAAARAVPDATAVVFDGRQLSYAELDALANRLAHHLIRLAVRPGQRIASLLGRGMNTIVAMLAVMKAGAVHVPLDPSYASARLGLILDDASPEWLLCDGAGHDALAAAAIIWPRTLDISADEAWSDAPADVPVVADADPRSLAYMIYTSGSTGIPKGVLVEHRGVVSLAHSVGRSFGLSERSRVSQFASVSFDVSIIEIVMAFAAGAALFLPTPEERNSPAAFVDFVGRHRITHVSLPPAFLQGYVGTPDWTHRPALILAGEALDPDLLRRWCRQARVFNAYGPTEISIYATVWACPEDGGEVAAVPIGGPVDNTRLYVLDRFGQPVPRGTVGELFIGGVGVARGYWKRPDLTAERFLPDPFNDRPDARMYRTGDQVRALPNGDLLFLGRNDHQVKLRGFRVELGEIEAQLNAHPLVRGSAVLVREDRPGDRRLVAYVVAGGDHGDLPGILRGYLAARLPDYMVPAAFVVLDALPLTTQGKLDRRALPVPWDAAFARQDYEAPQGAAEAALAALWCELLGIERVGRRDNFFDLGGHSLLAVRLAAAMRTTFGRKTLPGDVFAHPVLAELAGLNPGSAPARIPVPMDLGAEVVLGPEIAAAQPARLGTRVARSEPRRVLLTGVTGFLGTFLLHALLRRTEAVVYCLVRCADEADGWRRLLAAMRSFGLPNPARSRVVVLPGDLALPRLGLDERGFQALATRIDTIHHNGAWVDALHSYVSLRPANVSGTRELLRLAATGSPKHLHFISTMNTIPPAEAAGPGIDTEAKLAEFWSGLPSGYARSKWVAERILRLGRERGIPSTTYRLTHLGGATVTGASNPDDTWSLFVEACLELERVPILDEVLINSLPVDAAAAAIVELSLDTSTHDRELNLLNPEPFPLHALTEAIAEVGEARVEKIGFGAWRTLCTDRLGGARVSLVLPAADLAPGFGVRPLRPPVVLSNALDGAAWPGVPPFAVTGEMLRRYVTWRHRRSSLDLFAGSDDAVRPKA